MQRHVCPGCESAMQVFHTPAPARIEVDRCAFCGGLWFDAGELEAIAGHALEIEPLPGATTRRCASCTTTMETAVVRGTPIERCASCGSVYLDDGELAEVAGGRVPLSAQSGPLSDGAAHEPTFVCPGCAEEKPVYLGASTPRGLACANCYGSFDLAPTHLYPANMPLRDELLARGAGAVTPYGVGYYLMMLWRLFR